MQNSILSIQHDLHNKTFFESRKGISCGDEVPPSGQLLLDLVEEEGGEVTGL
jgi:hypothetical protein